MTCNQAELKKQLDGLNQELTDLKQMRLECHTEDDVKHCLVLTAQGVARVHGEIAWVERQIELCKEINDLTVGTWAIEATDRNGSSLPDFSGTLVISSWDAATNEFDGDFTLADGRRTFLIARSIEPPAAGSGFNMQVTLNSETQELDIYYGGTIEWANPPSVKGDYLSGALIQGPSLQGSTWVATKQNLTRPPHPPA
ncbi:hypothetical protein [Kitasatospora sp. NPDC056181]|uniref:hypothetical protein n=1 Tax=Kitasatospora sp. NPDC056181 TaxID=3345737 RepID=UPI0035DDA23F